MLNKYFELWNELSKFKRVILLLILLCVCILISLQFYVSTNKREIIFVGAIPDKASNKSTSSNDVDARIQTLLSQMSLEQKIAQMILVPMDDRGGLVSMDFVGAFTLNSDQLVSSNRYQRRLLESIEDAQLNSKEQGLPYIPPLISVQAHHGVALKNKTVVFPQAINLGASADEQLVKQVAKASIEQANEFGAKWLRTISTTQILDHRSLLTESTFSEDLALNQRLSVAHFEAINDHLRIFEANNWLSTSVNNNLSHQFPRSNRGALKQYLMSNQINAINHGASFLMLSKYNFDQLNRNNIKSEIDYIKNELNFEGVVVSSSNVARTLKGCLLVLCESVINAGVDMIAFESDIWDLEVLNGVKSEILEFDYAMIKKYIKHTAQAVNQGKIPLSRIDDAVSRILKVKLNKGLFDTDFEFMQTLDKTTIKQHKQIAREAVIKSAVLLKNQQQALPIKQGEKVLLIGDATERSVTQQGYDAVIKNNYQRNNMKKVFAKHQDVTWMDTKFFDPMYVINQLEIHHNEELRYGTKRVNRELKISPIAFTMDGYSVREVQEGVIQYNELISEYFSTFDKVILVLSEPVFSGHGLPFPALYDDVIETSHLNFALVNQYSPAFFENLRNSHASLVVLMFNSRGLYAPNVFNTADAVVSMFRPGTEIDGITDLLFTDEDNKINRDFTAKTPVSWPKYPCDFHNISGFKYYDPFFDVGYGLSYQHDDTDYAAWPEQIVSINSCVLRGVRAL